MDTRIIELALEALQARKTAVEAQIAELTKELRSGIGADEKAAKGVPNSRKRRSRTAAEKKAQSERMKAYWAAKRKSAMKPTKSKAPAKPKRGPRSAAAREAQSA